MCGRYSLAVAPEMLAALFRIDQPLLDLKPRFNIAPTQSAPVVRLGRDTERELKMLRWGLVPSWANDLSIGARMINARSETVHEKPAFRAAFVKRRCLVPTSGFYEWKRMDARTKQPFFIRRADGQALVMAGLWESWRQGDDRSAVETYTILTTEANTQLGGLHDRMPAILDADQFEAWLAADADDPAALQSLLKPAPSDRLVMRAVSRRVNSPAVDDPSLIEPEAADPQAEPPSGQLSLFEHTGS